MLDRLSGKRVLVTGGLGFIGSNIVNKIAPYCKKVFILDDLSSGNVANITVRDNIDIVTQDIRDYEVLYAICQQEVDIICHQAAKRSVPASFKDPKRYIDINVNGSMNIFEVARKFKCKVVCASSSSVYGGNGNYQSEIDDCSPKSPYAYSKYFMERLASLYEDVEITFLRYFNVYGKGQPEDDSYSAVIPLFMKAMKDNGQVTITGDGKQQRDFTHIDTVVEANISAMFRPAGTFNIGSCNPISINKLFQLLAYRFKYNKRPVHISDREGDVKRTCADITKMINILKVRPENIESKIMEI